MEIGSLACENAAIGREVGGVGILICQRLDMVVELLNGIKEQLARVSATDEAPDGRWLDSEEAARYLGLTSRAVRAGANAGRIPGHKYPAGCRRGRWKFRKTELDRWMERRPRRTPRRGAETW